jgi:hypothetical protein
MCITPPRPRNGPSLPNSTRTTTNNDKAARPANQPAGYEQFCFVHTLDPITPPKYRRLAEHFQSLQGRMPSRAHLKQLAGDLHLTQNAIKRWWQTTLRQQSTLPQNYAPKDQKPSSVEDRESETIIGGHHHKGLCRDHDGEDIERIDRAHGDGDDLSRDIELEQLTMQVERNWTRICQLDRDLQSYFN